MTTTVEVPREECVPIVGGYVCGVIRNRPARRRVLACPTEGVRRRMVQVFGGAWYSDRVTCLGCGDSWSDGERGYRPFARGWRQKAKAEARAYWDAALTPVEYDAVVFAAMQDAVGGAA